MKRLLLAATILLSTVTCNSDVPKITNVRAVTVTATRKSDQETTRRDSDFSGKQFWWKREKRRSGAQTMSRIRLDTEETFIPSGLRLFPKEFGWSPISLPIRYLGANGRRRSQQNEVKESTGREDLRYVDLGSMKLGEPVRRDESDFTLCNSKNGCPLLYPRWQGWQLQQPFYVEEPSWIEIDTDTAENQPIHRLKSTDPFVISRGKKIPATERSIYDDFNVSVRNRFIDDENSKTDEKDNDDDDDDDKSVRRRVRKNMIERGGDAFTSHRMNKFHLRNEADRLADHFEGNLSDDDLVQVIGQKKGTYKRNRLVRGHVETVVLPLNHRRNDKPSNLLDTLEQQPYYFSTSKMDAYRFDDQSNRSLQRSKLKRLDSNSDSDSNSNSSSNSNPSFRKLVVQEMLQRLIENLECNLEICRDNGRTTKRTRLGDGRGTLEDMLTKSDPFYVARGKRISPTFNDSFFFDG